MPLHSHPNAFSIAECERIIASIASTPKDDALLVGNNRDHNMRRAELVWVDNVDGLGWVGSWTVLLTSCATPTTTNLF